MGAAMTGGNVAAFLLASGWLDFEMCPRNQGRIKRP
jgi:hypothetical protein